MSYFFRNILIPVDVSTDATSALHHALNACGNDCNIHLCHIITDGNKWLYKAYKLFGKSPSHGSAFEQNMEIKMEYLRQQITHKRPDVNVSIHVAKYRNMQRGIIKTATEVLADLIIIEHPPQTPTILHYFQFVNGDSIAKQTGINVLQIHKETGLRKIKSVILPFSAEVPENKINLLSAITHQHKPAIHLVTLLSNKQPDAGGHAFIKTYRILSELLHYPVHLKVITDEDVAKNILRYATDIQADLILIDPQETQNQPSFFSANTGHLGKTPFNVAFTTSS